MAEDALLRIARTVLDQSIGLKPGERILLVGNPEDTSRRICDAYFQAVQEMGGRPLLARQPARSITEMADPSVLAAISTEPDVVFSISTDKLGKDPYGIHIGYVGRDGRRYDHIIDKITEGDVRCRVPSSPGILMETFLHAMEVDYRAIQARAEQLRAAVEGASEMHVETPAGTDLTVGLRGRHIFTDDGNLRQPGSHGNLPCGEIFFSPELSTARGRVVFDGVVAI